MLDFTSRPKVHEQVTALIDAALVAERAAQTRRTYLGGSRLGASCERALQYEYAQAPVDEGKDFDGRRLRIFEVGHTFEALAIRWLRLAGFDLLTSIESEEPEGEQFGFSVADGRIQGHGDGIVVGGPPELGWRYPMLLEIKSMADKPFKECVKKGVTLSKPVYAAQMAVYQAYLHNALNDMLNDVLRESCPELPLGLADNPALYVAVNKDTQALWFELVPFDGSLAQRMSDRGVRVVQATDAHELLPRGFAQQTHVECRMCSYAQRCWRESR